jgi:hypothetical protein
LNAEIPEQTKSDAESCEDADEYANEDDVDDGVSVPVIIWLKCNHD